MNNLLYLHEAIVIALINLDKKSFSASFEDIANFIEQRNLYTHRKGNIDLSTQIMLRTTKSKGKYAYLFEKTGSTTIRLRSPIIF